MASNERSYRLTSCAETCDNTGNEDEISTLGSSLQSTSNESEHSSPEETIDSSYTIGCPSTNETTNDGTEIVLQIQISLRLFPQSGGSGFDLRY